MAEKIILKTDKSKKVTEVFDQEEFAYANPYKVLLDHTFHATIDIPVYLISIEGS